MDQSSDRDFVSDNGGQLILKAQLFQNRKIIDDNVMICRHRHVHSFGNDGFYSFFNIHTSIGIDRVHVGIDRSKSCGVEHSVYYKSQLNAFILQDLHDFLASGIFRPSGSRHKICSHRQWDF